MNTKLKQAIKILEENKASFRLVKLKERAITVDDVIKFSEGKIKPDEICKTIVVKTKSGKFSAAFLLGKDKIDFAKLEKILGEKASVATAEEIQKATGLEIGAVNPLLLKMQIILDKAVLDKPEINFGSGDHLFGIILKPKDLVRVINPKIEDIKRSQCLETQIKV